MIYSCKFAILVYCYIVNNGKISCDLIRVSIPTALVVRFTDVESFPTNSL